MTASEVRAALDLPGLQITPAEPHWGDEPMTERAFLVLWQFWCGQAPPMPEPYGVVPVVNAAGEVLGVAVYQRGQVRFRSAPGYAPACRETLRELAA